MINADHHHMHFNGRHPSGAEEWFCPECGRRLLVNWTPDYHKTILAAGDDAVPHSGSHGDALLHIAAPMQIEAGATATTAPAPPVNDASFDTADSSYSKPAPDTSEPERTDGLKPWRRIIDRLGREGFYPGLA